MTETPTKPKPDRDWQAKRRSQQATLAVCVLDAASPKTRCAACKGEGLVFLVQVVSEPWRPIVALCKTCAIQRAAGEERVYVRELPGPWLRKFWKTNRREAKRNPSVAPQGRA